MKKNREKNAKIIPHPPYTTLCEEGVTLSLESLKRMDTCSKTTKKGAGMGEKEKACKFLVIHSINYVNVPI